MTDARVKAQLGLVLASSQFIKSERMSRFLRFVVERALRGTDGDLKEYSIGVEVFDKDPSFDPRIDNNVRTEARRLRAKLAEYYAVTGKNDPIIIDLPKGSYVPRFLAPEPAVPEIAPVARPIPAAAAVPPRSTWFVVAVIAVLTLAVGALVWRELQPARPAPKFRSIAVLPFLNLSGGDENEYFTAGLTEEILNHLAEVPSLKVVARTSSFQFKGKNADVRVIGKRLNVDAVLEGSVQRIGNRLRITPQLISTADGYHVWSEHFDRDADNLFALQDEISMRVVRALGISAGAVPATSPPNPKAYRLYLQARYHWNRWNRDDIARSIALLDEALVLDPKYGRAYAGLASAYGVLGVWGAAPADSIAKSRAAAEKAVELDPNSGDGYDVLACLKASMDHDWDGARRDFERGLALSPGSPDIHDDYAMLYLVPRMQLKEAETETRRAVGLDPLSLRVNTDLGSVLYFERDYDAAIAQFRQVLDLDSSFGNAAMQLFKCFLMTRRFAEARRIIEPREKSPYPYEFALHMGRLEALSGNRTEAHTRLREILEKCVDRCAFAPAQIAWLQTAIGDIDGAFRSLERTNGTIMQLQVDPELDPLRADPRYHALVAKMHLTP